MRFDRCLRRTLCIALFAAAATLQAQNADRLYGKITTRDGEVLEGLIRWGNNEAAWVDLFNGNKPISEEHNQEWRKLQGKQEERRELAFLGFRIRLDDDTRDRSSAGIRFGHIRTIVPTRSSSAMLTLRSGRQVEFQGGSNDLGRGLGKTVIEDARKGARELEWRDIAMVEFLPVPAEARSKFGSRLYGTLTTRQGEKYTGHVTWDADEILGTDVLDGEDRGKDVKLDFQDLASIRRKGWSACIVTLKSGREMVLDGSNDVDNDNRGIFVSDPRFGQITVPWDSFEQLDFQPDPGSPAYGDFAESQRLTGTVTTANGVRYTGTIRWDNDEEYGWEMLEGILGDIKFDVEMGLIRSIEKHPVGCLVTLLDGRSFDLSDYNDVDEDNQGIIVHEENGKAVLVSWEDFQKVEFEHVSRKDAK